MKLSSILCASVVACAVLASGSALAGKPVVTEAGTPPELTASSNGANAPGDCSKPPKKKGGGGGGHETGSLSTYRTSSTSCGGPGTKTVPAATSSDTANKKPQ
jgi:hypothetical protein